MKRLEPDALVAAADAYFCEAIAQVRRRRGRAVLVGLSGAQGSGKSTTAGRLVARLAGGGLNAFACSLDDFYLTRAERMALGRDVHPLLATRGVPGTHDVPLMDRVVTRLLTAGPGEEVAVPLFDKVEDDRRPLDAWRRVAGGIDVVLVEGWCMGARPQAAAALARPINALEREGDADGRWRRHVNARLSGPYAAFFARVDLRLMLRAPSFDCVQGWRAEQERGLDFRAGAPRQPMDDDAIARFIAYYERITGWLLEDEPADLIADLDGRRVPMSVRVGRP